jgi:23S rRNA pseudouridine2605 synthase
VSSPKRGKGRSSRSAKGSQKPAGDTSKSQVRLPRLQKVLALAGLGSRRACEELILAGRVEVDGRIAELGMRVDPDSQEIRVDGEQLKLTRKLYYALNKPPGVVCTHRDPSGRTRVIDLVDAPSRVFPIGRLDRSSEGLILLTNDGEFANLLAHPRYQVPKTYRVLVAGQPGRDVIAKLLRGVHLAEGVARAASVRVRKTHKQSTEMEIVLCEGKNREIRRILAKLGHKVMRLKRIAIGPVRLGKLPSGAYRPLTPAEVEALRAVARPQRRGIAPVASKKAVEEPPHTAGSQTPPASKPPQGKLRPGTIIDFD